MKCINSLGVFKFQAKYSFTGNHIVIVLALRCVVWVNYTTENLYVCMLLYQDSVYTKPEVALLH